jgi:nucleoside-diphosphate-sugar epimerase
VERIIGGEPIIVEAESSPGNRIHVDDLAACCVTAMTLPVPPGIYNVGDGDHRSSTAFSQSVAAALKLPPLPEVSLEKAKRTFSDLRLSFLTESRIVDTTKMREVMGFTPIYTDPLRGIVASVTN